MSEPRHLNLWKQRLGRVPESVWEQIDLETLVLADNDLTEVSARIGHLKCLRMLDLGHNRLTRLPDEIGDLDDRLITCHVNGELRQSARLGDMIFGVAETIALISELVPLRRGDIISMGTPSGVGIGFAPPRFLADGDAVTCEIEGVGSLRNIVRFVDSGRKREW